MFSGFLTFDLSKMPRGALSSRTCGLNVVSKDSATVNLFKVFHIKGWWPFQYTPIGANEPNVPMLTVSIKCFI
jgi:hypothetical protein